MPASSSGTTEKERQTRQQSSSRAQSGETRNSRSSGRNSSRRTSGRNGSGSTGRTRRKKRNRALEIEQTIEMAVMIPLFILCLVMLVGSFDMGGKVARALGTMQNGLFGKMSHLFPLIIYMSAGFLFTNKRNRLAYKKVMGVFLLFLLCCGFIQMLTEGYLPGYHVMDYYARSADYHVGGGAVGGILCLTLCSAFGKIVGLILLLLLIGIAIIIITQKSVVGFIQGLIDRILGEPSPEEDEPGQERSQRRSRSSDSRRRRELERKRQKEERMEARIRKENASKRRDEEEGEDEELKLEERSEKGRTANSRKKASQKTTKEEKRTTYNPFSQADEEEDETKGYDDEEEEEEEEEQPRRSSRRRQNRSSGLSGIGSGFSKLFSRAAQSLMAIQDDDEDEDSLEDDDEGYDFDEDEVTPRKKKGASASSGRSGREKSRERDEAPRRKRSSRVEEEEEDYPETLEHDIASESKRAPFSGISDAISKASSKKSASETSGSGSWLEDFTVDLEPTSREARDAVRGRSSEELREDPFAEAESYRKRAIRKNPALDIDGLEDLDFDLEDDDDED